MIAFEADPTPTVRCAGNQSFDDERPLRPAVDVVPEENDGSPKRTGRVGLDGRKRVLKQIETAVQIRNGKGQGWGDGISHSGYRRDADLPASLSTGYLRPAATR